MMDEMRRHVGFKRVSGSQTGVWVIFIVVVGYRTFTFVWWSSISICLSCFAVGANAAHCPVASIIIVIVGRGGGSEQK